MEESKPDLGSKILKQEGENAKHVFSPFGMFNLAWVDNKLYTTMSDIEYLGEVFAVSIDFSANMYAELARVLPVNIVREIRNKFRGNFVHPMHISWKSKVEIGIEAKLGSPVEDGEDVFVPFVAEKVFKVQI